MTDTYQNLTYALEDGSARITLNRPHVRNAFDRGLIDDLIRAFQTIAEAPSGKIRSVVLAGEGATFCAGADVNWMRDSLQLTEEENIRDALHMARMFETINLSPVPVIGRIHGAALGGGVGLVAVCDIAVAAEGTTFAFSEAKLGIAPAVISPYVLRKIGRSHARALFLTAERFDTDRAFQAGLIHIVKPLDQVDAEVERLVKEIATSAPHAVARAKALIAAVPDLLPVEAGQYTAETIAALRVSPEGQEGLRAFLDKRKPAWVDK
jgi:methylglutaconyl-CoA hydratase